MARSPSAAGRKKPAASHHTLDQFFQHNPLPMWVYDLETLAFLSVNDAAIEKYGYSEAEETRRSPDWRQTALRYCRGLPDPGSWTRETRTREVQRSGNAHRKADSS